MNKIEEFWYCVAPQEDLPLYKGQVISSESCINLIKLIELYKSKAGSAEPDEIITSIILGKPSIISDMRVLVGVSDKRLYLDLTYLANIYKDAIGRRLVSESREHLLKHDTNFFIRQLTTAPMKKVLAEQITQYFIERGLIDILNTFTSLDITQIVPIFDNLIATKEIQQMQAKYRGHGAEQAFAQIITACGMTIIPQDKDTDPMAGYDPNVDLLSMTVVQRNTSNENCHSFDLIVTENSDIRILIQSLIHSSDPGQYGVNKSDETIDISKRIASYNKSSGKSPVYLLGSVDGVGFSENPNGTIVKMLDVFDGFFQLHTLFKIPMFLQKVGLIDNVHAISFDTNYFDDIAIAHFNDVYMKPLGIIDMTGDDLSAYKTLEAGKATVIFK
ncbi:MAG: hypothetical protein IKN92_01020 [Clostridia bacterium]|nr:hypothetical protein [Clostridia bacterium]